MLHCEMMMIKSRWTVLSFILLFLMACGTLEVGIEQTPTHTVVTATAPATVTSPPTAVASPAATATSTVAPTRPPSPTASTSAARERITFAPGSTTYAFTANLTRGVPKAYVLGVLAGQQMIVTASGDVTIVVQDPQGRPLIPVSARQGQWVGAIPQTGDHTLILQGEGASSVTINIPPLGG